MISAVLTLVLLIFNRQLLMAFGASGNTIRYAADYMSIYAIGTVFVQLTLGMGAFITAQGFARVGCPREQLLFCILIKGGSTSINSINEGWPITVSFRA